VGNCGIVRLNSLFFSLLEWLLLVLTVKGSKGLSKVKDNREGYCYAQKLPSPKKDELNIL